MSQQTTTQYTSFTQSAEQKFVQAANSFMLKIMSSLVSAKQTLEKLLSTGSSRSPYLGQSIHVRDLRERSPVLYDNIACNW